MALNFFKLFFCSGILFFSVKGTAQKQPNNLTATATATAVSFPLFSNTVTPVFYYDKADAKVVQLAAEAFSNDINLLSGKTIRSSTATTVVDEYAVVAGTVGQSKIIDDLIKQKSIDVTQIKNKWECFSICIVKQKNSKLLVVAGSDRRGTAFGIFHLSRTMGVSPFVWWADVLPQKKQQLFVSGSYTSTEPSVQYRGIFINDEDWGLQPWAAKNMDTDIKDIGPKTYAKVFELLLRLKANYIWPAMHPCTKAFYYYKQNPKVADDYAIVVGGSHCEPMLRNNVCEWAETYEEEYKKKPGEWRYDLNKDEIYTYWNDRIKEAVNYESVFTVGMRGVHDGSMPGPKDAGEKVKLLEKVITDQREILQNNFKQPAGKLPQIFVPYKEVLSLYRMGMQLPDDITIIWPDDNHGYIRQLPNDDERKRSGGHGVYYHLSYWGSPADYLWLSSISPALIGYEMKKAYDYGAKKLWVFNVGDIKPAELEIQFAMDMAWDITTYDASNPAAYINNWATEIFGKENAAAVTRIKNLYYQLAAAGKPEHVGLLKFTAKEINERLEAYEKLNVMMDSLDKKMDKRLADAFFQLVRYPVEASCMMNIKVLSEKQAAASLAQNDVNLAKAEWGIANAAFEMIRSLSDFYNAIGGRKWNGMMNWHPRDQKVFDAPPEFDSLTIETDAGLIQKETKEAQLVKRITAQQLFENKNTAGCKLLPGVGISGAGIAGNENAVINYSIPLNAGVYNIVVKCLPTFAMEKEKQLAYTIALNNGIAQTANVHAEAETATWKENVLQGYSMAETTHAVAVSGNTTVTIRFRNKNVVISQIEIYKAP